MDVYVEKRVAGRTETWSHCFGGFETGVHKTETSHSEQDIEIILDHCQLQLLRFTAQNFVHLAIASSHIVCTNLTQLHDHQTAYQVSQTPLHLIYCYFHVSQHAPPSSHKHTTTS